MLFVGKKKGEMFTELLSLERGTLFANGSNSHQIQITHKCL